LGKEPVTGKKSQEVEKVSENPKNQQLRKYHEPTHLHPTGTKGGEKSKLRMTSHKSAGKPLGLPVRRRNALRKYAKTEKPRRKDSSLYQKERKKISPQATVVCNYGNPITSPPLTSLADSLEKKQTLIPHPGGKASRKPTPKALSIRRPNRDVVLFRPLPPGCKGDRGARPALRNLKKKN